MTDALLWLIIWALNVIKLVPMKLWVHFHWKKVENDSFADKVVVSFLLSLWRSELVISRVIYIQIIQQSMWIILISVTKFRYEFNFCFTIVKLQVEWPLGAVHLRKSLSLTFRHFIASRFVVALLRWIFSVISLLRFILSFVVWSRTKISWRQTFKTMRNNVSSREILAAKTLRGNAQHMSFYN